MRKLMVKLRDSDYDILEEHSKMSGDPEELKNKGSDYLIFKASSYATFVAMKIAKSL